MIFPINLLYAAISITTLELNKYKKWSYNSKVDSKVSTLKITRNVDNFEIISGTGGVPIEHWYNETTAEDPKYQSSPGCPQSIDGYPWVYHGQKCFLAGFRGPCKSGQKLALQSNSFYGICTCECFVEKKEYQLYLPNASGRYIDCVDTLRKTNIYDKLVKKCYVKFEQEPCKKGKVIASWTNDWLTCLPVCNHKNRHGTEIKRSGRCTKLPVKSSAAVFALHMPFSGSDDQFWSRRLRRCIYKRPPEVRHVG